MNALHVADLKFRYGTKEALKGVSFDIATGQFCALLGPNGAGKSTLFSLLTGLLLRLDSSLHLSEIAKQSGLTLRTMARLFAAEMKISPGKCYQNMRLSRARELMDQQGMKAADAASLCGFSCAAALKRALKASLPD